MSLTKTVGIFLLLFGLAGCGLLTPKDAGIPVSAELSEPAKKVQVALNESRVVAMAMVDDIVSKEKRGIITATEALARLDKVKGYRDDIEAAQKAFNLGDIAGAESMAAALELLLEKLEVELEKLEREKRSGRDGWTDLWAAVDRALMQLTMVLAKETN